MSISANGYKVGQTSDANPKQCYERARTTTMSYLHLPAIAASQQIPEIDNVESNDLTRHLHVCQLLGSKAERER
eukprot:3666754-Amphidinium_carterae.1